MSPSAPRPTFISGASASGSRCIPFTATIRATWLSVRLASKVPGNWPLCSRSSSSSIFHRPSTLPNVCLKVPRLRAPPITQHAPLTVHVSLSIPWQGDTLAAASHCRSAAARARAPDGGQPLVVRCARLRRRRWGGGDAGGPSCRHSSESPLQVRSQYLTALSHGGLPCAT